MAARKSRYKFSNFVFSVIDQAGINQDMKNIRIRFHEKSERKVFQHIESFSSCIGDFIFTGSTSEGVIPMTLSDSDCMQVYNDIICVDDPNGETNSILNILKADYENVSPGYIKVVPVQMNTDNISSVFCSKSYLGKSKTGEPYLSSTLFQNLFKQACVLVTSSESDHILMTEYNGPAVTITLNHAMFDGLAAIHDRKDIDYVTAIRFCNSSILSEWATRPRYYDWPSRELVKEVSTTEGYILPIGEKASENQTLEWRISYVTAEKKMVLNFNSTHDKLYVILKMFSKQVFTSVSKAFSSYMVKNVILWMAEINPSGEFTPDLLIDRLLQSLSFIKHCLQNNHLPNYIMPKRNLLADRLFGQEKQELINLLTILMNEEENIVHRLPRLSMYLHYVAIKPELFACFGLWRNYLETLYLKVPNRTDADNKLEMLYTSTAADNKYLLLKLLVPDHLERESKGQFNEVNALVLERLKSVLNCCFLK